MAYPKGAPKPEKSGRKKGTPNKETQDLFAICEKHNVNVFESMVILAVQEVDINKKFERLTKIAPYLYAQRKAVELSNDEEKGFKIVIEDFRSKDGE
jgi:hypothetical protein